MKGPVDAWVVASMVEWFWQPVYETVAEHAQEVKDFCGRGLAEILRSGGSRHLWHETYIAWRVSFLGCLLKCSEVCLSECRGGLHDATMPKYSNIYIFVEGVAISY
jgi:hypothetical protein